MFYLDNYEEIGGGLGEKFGISRQFAENNLGWLIIIGALMFVTIGMILYDLKHSIKEMDTSEEVVAADKPTSHKFKKEFEVSLKLASFYTFAIYPIVVFNLIMTLLTLYINNIRINIDGSISEHGNAFGMLVGSFVSGMVFIG